MRYLKPVSLEKAQGLAARVFDQIRRDFGVVADPLSLHSPVPVLLAGAWCALREIVVVGRVPRAHKEAVAAAVSRANDCPFCVEAHTMMLAATGANRAARALWKGEESSRSPEVDRYVRWAEATRAPGDPILRDPPFSSDDAPEILGTAACFQYINRMTTVFGGESPLPKVSAGLLKGPSLLVFSRMFTGKVRGEHRPGDSFRFLPAGGLPPETRWAEPNPWVAGALARWWRGIRDASERLVPQGVAEWGRTWLESWWGEDPPLGREWLDRATSRFAEDRPVARLVLLSAVAPHRVTEGDVEAFRDRCPSDAELVATVAQGSALAALRISEWLA